MRVSAEVKLILSVHPGQRTEQQLAKVSISFLVLKRANAMELKSVAFVFSTLARFQTECCQVFGTDARCMSL